ncbi:tetratricopeptide repeat protein [bacterium]|nr:tetratricopeptide repeat protein [bacterium]
MIKRYAANRCMGEFENQALWTKVVRTSWALVFSSGICLQFCDSVWSVEPTKTFNIGVTKNQEVKKANAVRKLDLGNFNLYHGNTNQAIEAYKTAIAFYPDLWEAHYGLANCYVSKRKYNLAIDQYLEVLSIKPNHKESNLVIANLFRAQGRLDDSLKYYQRASSAGLKSSDLFTSWGLAQAQSGHLDEAIKLLEQGEALSQKKKNADIYLGKGVVHYKQGNLEEAIKQLDIAIKKSGGKNPQARNFKAEILYATGKKAEAISEYETEINHEDALPAAFQALGNIYLNDGKIDDALKIFERGRKWYPSNVDILLGRAVCFEKQNKLPEAILAYRKAILRSKNKMAMQNWIKHVQELVILVAKGAQSSSQAPSAQNPMSTQPATVVPN